MQMLRTFALTGDAGNVHHIPVRTHEGERRRTIIQGHKECETYNMFELID
jgi:hypothetical protein